MFESIGVTGVSLISSLGNDAGELRQALREGRSGLSPYIPDGEPGGANGCWGQIEINFTERLGATGWRHCTRASLLTALAGRILLGESPAFPPQRDETGISLGYNADASVHQFFSSFFSAPQQNHSRWVNPTAFINFSNNASASLLSIHHQCRGPIFTVTTGFTAGLDALNVAATAIAGGHAAAMLAGAVQEINPELLASFAALPGEKDAGLLQSTSTGGVVAGEGCALLALEKLSPADRARARAWLLGYGEAVSLPGDNDVAGMVLQAARRALADAETLPKDVDAVFLSANGNGAQDQAEAAALKVLFGNTPPPAAALKGAWGECYHAGAAMAAAAAVLCLEENFVPPTVNLAPDCDARARGLSSGPQTVHARKALILSLDRDKKSAALVLGFPGKE